MCFAGAWCRALVGGGVPRPLVVCGGCALYASCFIGAGCSAVCGRDPLDNCLWLPHPGCGVCSRAAGVRALPRVCARTHVCERLRRLMCARERERQCVCVCARMCGQARCGETACARTPVCTCEPSCMRAHTHVCARARVRMCVCARGRTHVCARTHVCVCAHTHDCETHVCVGALVRSHTCL